MSQQLNLACPTDHWALCACTRSSLQHAAVPDAHALVRAARREDKRAVLVPVEAEQLTTTATWRDEECGGGHRVCKGGGPGEECGRAKVEELERAVAGAGGDEVRMMWGE